MPESRRDFILSVLTRIARALPPPPLEILLAGSGSFTVRLLPDHRSLDIDLAEGDDDRILKAVNELGLAFSHEKKAQNVFYVDVAPTSVFMYPRDWRSRAETRRLPNGHLLILPDPVDALLAKLKRWDDKDVEDAAQVMARLSELQMKPPEDEIIRRLQSMLDMYRPRFDEETPAGDPWFNTRQFFKDHYGREIDVRKEIVIPGVERLNRIQAEMERLPPIPPRPDRPRHATRAAARVRRSSRKPPRPRKRK